MISQADLTVHTVLSSRHNIYIINTRNIVVLCCSTHTEDVLTGVALQDWVVFSSVFDLVVEAMACAQPAAW
jgi:hypothetical protein